MEDRISLSDGTSGLDILSRIITLISGPEDMIEFILLDALKICIYIIQMLDHLSIFLKQSVN